MSPRVLVTGAAGFIGSTLTEELVRAGYRVRAMVRYNSEGRYGLLELVDDEVRNEIDLFFGDIRDPHRVYAAVEDCTIVFHLAALIAIPYSYAAPESFLQTNVMGTQNVARACLDAGVERVVHTSTSETYGSAQYTPIDEEHPLVAQSPYTASKIGADKVMESFHLSYDLPVVTLRPFNTFGPRQSARAVIPAIIAQILAGKHTICLGSLEPVREFNFVKDTVRGFIVAAERPGGIGKTINIGCGKGISIGQLVELIAERCDVNVKVRRESIRVRPEKSEVMKLICNNSKARQVLGWEPCYSLRQGIDETIAWMRLNMLHYRPQLYAI